MTNEQEQFNPMEPLDPAYEALQRRLLKDGAAWRAGLPSTERLERRLNTLKNQQRAAQFHASSGKRGSSLRVIPHITEGYMMFRGRFRAALAVTAIAVVVVLFVVVFYGFAGGHNGQTGNAGKTTPTASPAANQFTQAPGLSNLKASPMVAPSNPQVVYELIADGSGKLTLARTDDAGKSWKNFAVPAGRASDQFPPTIFLNPVDAQSVFLVVGGTRAGNGCSVSHALASYSTLSGGTNICALEYVSKDGGADWSQVRFLQLGMGIVGDTVILDGAFGPIMGNNVLRPQGSRLYAAYGPYSQYNQLEGTAGARLVESNDGGSSWQFIDNVLPGAGYICDIAPAPTGSTVFAITSNITCSAGGGEVLTLWRSDNAGASWSQVGTLPGNTDQGMVAVSSGNAAQPLLYINMPTLVGGGSTFPRTGRVEASSPAALQVSADGGKTWHAAPAQGLPNGTSIPGGPPLGVLHDGSLVFAVSGLQGKTQTTTFYAWKSGDASWHKITPVLTENVQAVTVASDGASGEQSLWVVTAKVDPTKHTQPPTLLYSVQSYQLSA